MSNRQCQYNAIAIVVPAIAREGITKQVANQITAFQQKGVPVRLVVIAESKIKLLEEYGVELNILPVLQLHQAKTYLSVGAFAGAITLVRPILQFLKVNKVAVVIAHAPYAHFVLRLAKLVSFTDKYRFRLICYFHGLQYSEYPVNTLRRRVVNKLNKWLAHRTDDAHISVSKVVKKEISEHLIVHPLHEVIYNSVTEQNIWHIAYDQPWHAIYQILQTLGDKFIILMPNRIDVNKGQLFFLDVLNNLISRHKMPASEIAVLIVGDGPLKEEVGNKIQQLGLQKVVLLIEPLPNAVVRRLMKKVHLVVIPSFIEGLPLVLLEALQQNAVVLASDISANREVITSENIGWLFKAGDAEDCVTKLQFLYQNKDQQLIDPVAIEKHLASNFSFEKHMQQLLAVINNT